MSECQDCAHFIHARHANGRIDRRTWGTCTFVVNWPVKVPMTYSMTYRNPTPSVRVWADSNAEECSCYTHKSHAQEMATRIEQWGVKATVSEGAKAE